MSDQRSLLAPGGLIVGGVLGMAGSFVRSESLRGLLWGIDGTALVIAAALLTVRYFRRGSDMVAAGFLVFMAGEALILSGAAMSLTASIPAFGAGVGLWAAALAIISGPAVMQSWVRVVAIIAAVLFADVAVQIFMGATLTSLTRPLPFFAYPFLVVTLFGWAWADYKGAA